MATVGESRRAGDEPITATIIAPLGTMPQGTVAQTPDHLPNVTLKMVRPLVAIAIRFANTYVATIVGMVPAAAVTGVIPASDFLHLVAKCAGLSLAGPIIGLGKDLVTILTGLEAKFPLQTGNV